MSNTATRPSDASAFGWNNAAMRHIARKRFGQHFLSDAGIVDEIVGAIDPQPGDNMVEIGPGLAALTKPLLQHLPHLTVIELDRDLASRLRADARLTVIEADVLRVDFAQLAASLGCVQGQGFAAGPPLGEMQPPRGAGSETKCATVGGKLRVVGNLPYNISTPILFHLLPCAHLIQDQHFMLQKEVVDRMVAPAGSSDYSRLSVMLQWRYEMQDVLFVPPTSFDPPPRVNSAVVRMVPRPAPAAVGGNHLSALVQTAFSQRRKLLRHTLGAWLQQQGYEGSFDLQRRAQEVPVSEYLSLAMETATGVAD